jgi:hypothetical protein
VLVEFFQRAESQAKAYIIQFIWGSKGGGGEDREKINQGKIRRIS